MSPGTRFLELVSVRFGRSATLWTYCLAKPGPPLQQSSAEIVPRVTCSTQAPDASAASSAANSA
jgi:hypothetical protein